MIKDVSANYEASNAYRTNFENAFHVLIKSWRFNNNGKFSAWNCRSVSNTHWESFSITDDHLKKYYKR